MAYTSVTLTSLSYALGVVAEWSKVLFLSFVCVIHIILRHTPAQVRMYSGYYMSYFHLYISFDLTFWVAYMTLESSSAYKMYLFNLRIANHILIKIFYFTINLRWPSYQSHKNHYQTKMAYIYVILKGHEYHKTHMWYNKGEYHYQTKMDYIAVTITGYKYHHLKMAYTTVTLKRHNLYHSNMAYISITLR